LECSRAFVRKSELPSSGGWGASDVDSGLAPGNSSQVLETSATNTVIDREETARVFEMSPRGDH
jgi:hypothetical protein